MDRVSDSPTHTSLPAATSGTIPPHARCVACRYELAGLSPEGLCPECAAPIEMTLEILRKAADIETPLREMALGLGAIKIAYIIAAANAALIALATLVDIGVVWALMAFLALLSSLLVGGALISGHAALATPLPDTEGRTPGFRLGTLIGVGILGLVLGPLVLLPMAIGFDQVVIFLLFLLVIAAAPICILFGMGMLAATIERRTQPSKLLRASRIAAYIASLLVAIGLGAYATNALNSKGAPASLFWYLLVTALVAYPAAHLMLTITLSRAINKAIRNLPPPAPPAAL